jgi:hypothetical protein
MRLWTVCNLLKRLEAAIGIEPMNKGFVILESLFSEVLLCALTCAFIGRFNIPTVRVFRIWISVLAAAPP